MWRDDFNFNCFSYGPVIELPPEDEVFDFTGGYDPQRTRQFAFGVGKYNERRPGMYLTELFLESEGVRDIHIGVDIAAPVGTPVLAFFDGRVHLSGVNSDQGDYGGTIITEHDLGDRKIWALHGHLSHDSIAMMQPGTRFRRGQVIASIGTENENGGWNPHLHFQLSWERPERCDMPGVVAERDLERALRIYPDPRHVLGPLY
jgi:murein DD-endopeptidase MepM/ murein hydrolase activator NlpD